MTQTEFDAINIVYETNKSKAVVKLEFLHIYKEILSKVKINKIIGVGFLLRKLNIKPQIDWNINSVFELLKSKRIVKARVSTPEDWLEKSSETQAYTVIDKLSNIRDRKARLKYLKELGYLDEIILDVVLCKSLEYTKEDWSYISNLILEHTSIRSKKDKTFFSKGILELLRKTYGD